MQTNTLKPRPLWSARMAWRDSRGNRGLLALYMLSVVFGIAAIVAILSLRINLAAIIDAETRTLLGADLVIDARQEPTPALRALFRQLGGRQASEVRMRSMALMPESGSSHFVSLRASDGTFPFYGQLETTDPANPWSRMVHQPTQSGLPPAMVEESLLLQLGLQPGARIQLGSQAFEIVAALIRVAGESEVSGFFAPRVYVPLDALDDTGLLTRGSIVRFRQFFAFEDGLSPAQSALLADAKLNLFIDALADAETVQDRRASIDRVLSNLFDFLSLIAFSALLLGGVGIAGAVQVFLKSKLNTIAILRCLGCPARTAFITYLLQIAAFGFAAATTGTALGVATQFALPILIQGFLPFEVDLQLVPSAILSGLLFGFLSALLFALLPLLRIRKVSPLHAIRSAFDSHRPANPLRDPLQLLTILAIAAGLSAFVVLNTRTLTLAAAFIGAIAVALALLAATAAALRAALRRFLPPAIPYAARLAMGNLYRPNNRTLLMVTTLGVGFLLLNTLFTVQRALLDRLAFDSAADAPNVIALDIQPDQLQPLKDWIAANPTTRDDTPTPSPSDPLPVVTMRVSHIKGQPLSYWRQLQDSPVEDWVFRWEFRNTFRDHVLPNATVIDGTFTATHDGSEPFPVSVSENVLDDLGIGLGDTLTWDVQGIPIASVVTSIRRVRWEAGRQNFNFVFPLNSIEAAPTIYALPLKSASRLATARFQAAVFERFPNVSLIDLSLVFDSLNTILSRASFVIQFMALFTVATGLMVLAGSMLASRYQRIGEAALFRTIGAPKRFILAVITLEFAALGLISSLAGWLLSAAASAAILKFQFELPVQLFHPTSFALLIGFCSLTTFTGWLTSMGIAHQPPLAVLRANAT